MKTIVLMPIRNEAWILKSSLTNISTWADIIIVADQMSGDGSREICHEFSKVVLIDNKSEGHSNTVRWQLLKEARKYPGNNLIVCIDADEVVATDIFKDTKNFEKYSIGQSFSLPWIQLWKSPYAYRIDSGWDTLKKECAFIDDRKMEYEKAFVINDHTSRIPPSPLPTITLDSALLHLEYVPFKKSQIKQAWYRCSELIKKIRSARRINATYSITLNGPSIITNNTPSEWLKNNVLPGAIEQTQSTWHKKQILEWFNKYGIEYFEPLDIWHIDEFLQEFTERIGRNPQSQHFPRWLIKLNSFKNKLKNL